MWKNTVKQGRPQMTIRRMRIACWITKATHTHSQYVTLIAFPLQEWLQERVSILYVHCLPCSSMFSTITLPSSAQATSLMDQSISIPPGLLQHVLKKVDEAMKISSL
jgi:hypothetical protein